ncbi:MAG: MotA/TolQ/ExbB proton channel family protein [Prevotellaceae bacterium]|jgi:biopolymer transport protein ExbB|nr:MotA/TolQ/ExbB proton channel family protein [Prevotellaceae bacterium]
MLLQAQTLTDTLANAAAQVTTTEIHKSLWDILFKDGGVIRAILIVALILLLLITVYLIIERLVTIKTASKNDQSFMSRIKDYIFDGKIDSALNLCRSTNTPTSRMIEKGITRLGRPMEDVRLAIENVGNIEVAKLEKGLPILASVAGGAPMLGLLGTVTGMIRSFMGMENAGDTLSITTLSSGIYEALIMTAGGIFVGLVSFFAYNYLVTRVSQAMTRMETDSMEFMDILNAPAK